MVGRTKALSNEIQKWRLGGKNRSIAQLSRLTGIPRTTLQGAADGKVKLNGYYVIRVLSVISSPEKLKLFVVRYLAELKPFLAKLTDDTAKRVSTDVFSDLECRVLTDALFEDTPVEKYLSGEEPLARDAVARLIDENFITIVGAKLAPTKELLMSNPLILGRLAKFSAKHLELGRQGNYASLWIGNCSDRTRNKLLEFKKDIELRYGEIQNEYEPGPHRVALVTFITDLGGEDTV